MISFTSYELNNLFDQNDYQHDEMDILSDPYYPLDDVTDALEKAIEEFGATATQLPDPIEQGPASPYFSSDVPLDVLPGTPASPYNTNEVSMSPGDYSVEGIDDSNNEAFQSEIVNSFDNTVKQEIKAEPVKTDCAILNAYYHPTTEYYYPTECLAPQVETKPLLAVKVKSTKRTNNIQKPKKQNALKVSVGSRVTMEAGFKLEVPASEDGKRYIHRDNAEQVGKNVKARQRKISNAGHPSEGKGGSGRSAYVKLHDALSKAKWKREIVGEFYRYYKAE